MDMRINYIRNVVSKSEIIKYLNGMKLPSYVDPMI